MAIGKHDSYTSHKSRGNAQQSTYSIAESQRYSLTLTASSANLLCDDDVCNECCSDAVELNTPLQIIHASTRRAITVAGNDRHSTSVMNKEQDSENKL